MMSQDKCIKCGNTLSVLQKKFCSIRCSKAYHALQSYRRRNIKDSQSIRSVQADDGKYGSEKISRSQSIRAREQKIFDLPIMDLRFDGDDIKNIRNKYLASGERVSIVTVKFKYIITNKSHTFLYRTPFRVSLSRRRMMLKQFGGGKDLNDTSRHDKDVKREINERNNEKEEDKIELSR